MFQLVLQFSPWSGLENFDQLVALEGRLIAVLEGHADVDGHDMGSNEANIFILTADPRRTLVQCLPTVEASGLSNFFSAGHRALDGEQYTRAWPQDDDSDFSVK